MLAFGLIFALTATSALAKPTGNGCIFMCEAQPGGYGGSNGAYTQPGGFGGSNGAYTQPGGFGGSNGAYTQPGYGQAGSGFGQAGTGFGRPAYGSPMSNNLEDFSSVPAHQEVVQQQIPVQPEINGIFSHSSSKFSHEANNGFLQIRQPGVTRTVISESIRQPRPARLCQNYYEPCY